MPNRRIEYTHSSAEKSDEETRSIANKLLSAFLKKRATPGIPNTTDIPKTNLGNGGSQYANTSDTSESES